MEDYAGKDIGVRPRYCGKGIEEGIKFGLGARPAAPCLAPGEFDGLGYLHSPYSELSSHQPGPGTDLR